VAARDRPRPDGRTPLDRQRVLRAAIDLADTDGVSALTMRRLGQALGVEAMSLYNHVANKDDLLAGILDQVVGEVELPTDERDWKATLRAIALSANGVLRRHPWAADLLVTRPQMIGTARHRQMDHILRTLREAGFSVVETHHAFHVLDTYISAFTLQQVNFPAPSGDLGEMARRFLRDFPSDEYPALAEHIGYHAESGTFDEGDFEFGLDLILDSLERLPRSDGRAGDPR
jgi:AcrR family transcriptional regulator